MFLSRLAVLHSHQGLKLSVLLKQIINQINQDNTLQEITQNTDKEYKFRTPYMYKVRDSLMVAG